MTSHGPGTAIISLIDPVTSEKLAPPILLRLDAPNCTPRRLIRLLTIGCNYSLLGHFGFSSKILMCYPKGAHRLGILWLQFPTLGCKVSFAHFPGQRRRNNYLRSNQWEDWTNCMPWTSWTPSYMQIWPFSPPSRPEAQNKSFAEQMTHTMRRLGSFIEKKHPLIQER